MSPQPDLVSTSKDRKSRKAQIDLLELLASACEAASAIVRTYYSGLRTGVGHVDSQLDLAAFEKDPDDPRTVVTKVDRLSNDAIVSTIQKELYCAVLCEDPGYIREDRDAEYRIIIDSLDGTKNFISGSLGLFGISVGIEREGHLVAGAVALPEFGEILLAEAGKPVKLGSSPKGVADWKFRRFTSHPRLSCPLSEARVCIGRGAAPPNVVVRPPLSGIVGTVSETVNYASCTVGISSVAMGRIDGLVLPRQHYWDFAGGPVIIRELGGRFGVWREGWESLASNEDLSKADEESYFNIVATLQPGLFDEIASMIRTNAPAVHL